MKNKKYLYLAIAIILIAGGYYWYKKAHPANTQVQYVTTTAEKGTLTTSVSASGNIIVDQSASVDPDINGIVTNVSVNVGDSVKKGQLLFNIVNDQLGISVNKDQASYTSAKASLESAEAAIQSAKSSLKSVKKSTTSVHEDKLAAQEKIDASKISKTASQQALDNSLQSLNYDQQQAAKRNVMSPINGTVNAINVKNGDNLGASSSTHTAPIIIGDLTTLKAQVQVNEVDVTNVSIGQKVTLTFDAIPGFTATGKVEKMDSLGTTTQGVVTYNVTIGFDSLDPRIKPDMSVTAAIITSLKQDVITVPSSAVKTQNGSSFVQVLNGPTPTQVPVEVGASNSTDTEITSGINPGDKVVTQTINPGATSTSTSPVGGGSAGGTGGANRVFRGFGG